MKKSLIPKIAKSVIKKLEQYKDIMLYVKNDLKMFQITLLILV